jgi:uncharacterized protein YcgI (DUF1989 family)
MPSSPTAIVTDILDITDDPANPGVNSIYTVVVKFLFFGPVPLEQQVSASIANSSNKAQIKTDMDNAIIAAATGLGQAINANRIFTVADLAG